MIHAIGTDLVDLDRLEQTISKTGERFLAKILTPAERSYCESKTNPTPSVGARFAAKEAAMKCLGTGWGEGLGFHEIEVVRDDKGAPSLALHGRAAEIAAEKGIQRWFLSLSHTDGHALAMAVAES